MVRLSQIVVAFSNEEEVDAKVNAVILVVVIAARL